MVNAGSITRIYASNSVHGRDQDVIGLFVAFSRFEHALKKCGFLHPGKDAKANWDAFAQHVTQAFGELYQVCNNKLRTDIDELVANPPKVQIVASMGLDWEKRAPFDSANISLAIYIRRIRNNLFHGAKDPLTDRDRWLAGVSLDILDQFLQMDNKLRVVFLR